MAAKDYEVWRDISPQGCVDFANQLIELCELPCSRILTVQNIKSNFLVVLFESATGVTVPDLLLGDDPTTEAHNVQAVINTLSLDHLGISLSHITGEDIVAGDILSILNLLDILKALYLYLHPYKAKKLKAAYVASTNGAPTTEDQRNKFTKKTAPIKNKTSSSEENALVIRRLKRKTCRSTLHKYPQNPPSENKIPEILENASAGPSHSKEQYTTIDGLKTSTKENISKPSTHMRKRSYTEGIEDIYNSNFEMKVRIMLQCDKSPILRARQMTNNYIQSLKAPVKKTYIPSSRKSFLLPHNLERKRNRKSLIRKSPERKRSSQRETSVKRPVSEAAEDGESEEGMPRIFKSIMKQFPGFKLPKNARSLLTKQYYQHVGLMHKELKAAILKKPAKVIQEEKAIEEQTKLNKILIKDLREKDYLKEVKERKFLESKIKYSFRDERLRTARMRQYFEEFHSSMSKKLQKRNFSEEVLVEKTFKEVLEIQKEKVRELCQRLREIDEQDAQQHRQYIDNLKNLYQQQLAMLNEQIASEQRDSCERAKAQKLAAERMNREFCQQLQREVRSLHRDVLKMIEDIHFRELDAQNFIESFREQEL